MATGKEALVSAFTDFRHSKRTYPYENGIRPGTLAAVSGAPTLSNLLPLSFNDATGFWNVWSQDEDAVYTITTASTAGTAGTFTLTFNGETTAAIAFDATAAEVQAAIEALGSVDIGDVACVATAEADLGVNDAVVTITFGGKLSGVDVNGTADMTGITGNDHVFAEVTAGAGADTNEIDGFLVAPNGQATSASAETLIQVFRRGAVHRDDVPVPSGESQNNLDAALKRQHLRKVGIDIFGLAGVS